MSIDSNDAVRQIAAKSNGTAYRIGRNGPNLFLWNAPNLSIGLFKRVFLWGGAGILDGKPRLSPEILRERPECLYGNGVFLDIGRTTEIRSDHFGLMPIYYSDTFVTNRLHLAAIAGGELDFSAAVSCFYIDNAFCSQLATINTPVKGTKLLMPWERAAIGQKRIEVTGQPDTYSRLTPKQYRDLIHAGMEDVKASVQAVFESNHFVQAAITAGKDSRIVLSALAATNHINDVRFTTSDIDDDVDVGSGLVQMYGGRYGGQQARYLEVHPFELAVDRRRSVLYGLYHDNNASQFSPVAYIRNKRQLLLGGGCGEIYRSFYKTLIFRDQFFDLEATPKNVLKFLHGHQFFKKCWPKLLDVIAPMFAETLDKLPGDTIGDKLDFHYFAFRNRFHFGSAAGMGYGGTIGFHPLQSKHLLAAARGLPNMERQEGRVLFDLIRTLQPGLENYPFDKPWGMEFRSSDYHWPNPSNEISFDFSSGREFWKRASEENRMNFPKVARLNIPQFRKERTLENIEKIRATIFSSFVNDRYLSTLDLSDMSSKKSERAFSKIQSLADFGEQLKS